MREVDYGGARPQQVKALGGRLGALIVKVDSILLVEICVKRDIVIPWGVTNNRVRTIVPPPTTNSDMGHLLFVPATTILASKSAFSSHWTALISYVQTRQLY